MREVLDGSFEIGQRLFGGETLVEAGSEIMARCWENGRGIRVGRCYSGGRHGGVSLGASP